MSVGDIKGARRRMKIARAKGHVPKKRGLSTAQMIERNRVIAARMAKASGS